MVIAHAGIGMNVQIDEEYEELVRSKIEAGPYESAAAVVSEALRLLEERDRFLSLESDAIRDKIAAGLTSLRAGLSLDGEAVFQRIAHELDAADRQDP